MSSQDKAVDVSSSPSSSSFDLNSSIGSLVHLRGCDAFPKHPLPHPSDSDEPDADGSRAVSAPFTLLPGEYLTFVGRAGGSVIALSNYRLFLCRLPDGHCQGSIPVSQFGQDVGSQGVVNIPLGLLEHVECRDIFFMHVICKDARSIRCTFDTNEACLEWCKRLLSATIPPKRIEDVFAFAHYAWMREDNPELHQTLANAAFPRGLACNLTADGRSHDTIKGRIFDDEVRRMGFDLKNAWRISRANADLTLCASYPRDLIVPASVKDEDLGKVARFRSSQRFPVVVWRHQENGCVIARCSQPEVGWLGYRDANDEAMVRAIATSCTLDGCNGLVSNTDRPRDEDADGDATCEAAGGSTVVPTLLIMDARSYAAAVANKLKGGGCECSEYYPNCEVQFMGLANIHSIRKSFQSVRTLCAAYADHPNWFSGLENTKWLHHIGGLLRSALVVASTVDQDRRPVLVHCSDGWDRTPQIVALAQLLLDPHYRTMDGFQILVEREWLDFGHKFGDRCGHGVGAEDVNERCPVFLQWLDCVQQLLNQFPCAFEFNTNYLVKLLHHVYSCLYGTFLCNSEQERSSYDIRLSTHSVWAFLRHKQSLYRNYLYARKDAVLWPSCLLRDFVFWSDVYLQTVDSIRSDDPIGAACCSQAPPSSSQLANANGPITLTEMNSLLSPAEASIVSLSTDNSEEVSCPAVLTKTRSCADLSSDFAAALDSTPRTRRRSSDPNFNDQLIADSKSAEDFISAINAVQTNGPLERTAPSGQSETAGVVAPDPDSEVDEDATLVDGGRPSTELRPFLGIESSTDTIVEDVAALAMNPNEHRLHEHTPRCSSPHATVINCCRLDHDVVELSLHASTSTTDISDSHVAVNRKACQQHDAHWKRYIDLSGGIDRAGSNGISTTATATADQMDLVRHFFYFTETASTPSHSRTPSSGFPATPSDDRPVDGCGGATRNGTNGVGRVGESSVSSNSSSSSAAGAPASSCMSRRLDVDGLPVLTDEVQQRLHDVLTDKQRRVNSLQHSLCLAKIALCQQVCLRCNATVHNVEPPEEVRSLPDSVGSGCGDLMSLGHACSNGNASDFSWEQVEEQDTRPTLWVPDHAVTRCMGCDSEFCIVRRKHHCRNCGKIFCADCSSQMTPIPHEQLYHPVRVCTFCYDELGGFGKEDVAAAAAENWIPRATTAALDSD